MITDTIIQDWAAIESDLTSSDLRYPENVEHVTGLALRRTNAGTTEVLLVQEAKTNCYGLWYLPAGRVESGETILEAVKREVAEESHLQCEPRRLISTELGRNNWFRFTFLVDITGGRLKTLNDADQESLQANWFDVNSIDPHKLRHRDIVVLINNCLDIFTMCATPILPVLPVAAPCENLTIRLLLITKDKQRVVLSRRNPSRVTFPAVSQCPSQSNLQIGMERLLKAVGCDLRNLRLLGLSHLHCQWTIGAPGVCLTVCYQLLSEIELKPPFHSYALDERVRALLSTVTTNCARFLPLR